MAVGTQRRPCNLGGQEAIIKVLQYKLAPDMSVDEPQGGQHMGFPPRRPMN